MPNQIQKNNHIPQRIKNYNCSPVSSFPYPQACGQNNNCKLNHYLNFNFWLIILQSSELQGQLLAFSCEALMINDMGKAARQWPERIKLTLNSVVLLAFCFCTLHTMTLLRVPVFWLSFTNIRFYIFYTCLSRNHSQMLCKTYFIT